LRENQDDRIYEEPSGRRKNGTGTKDCTTCLDGATIGKGRTIGRGNRRNESMYQTYRIGGG
jgi:hypothetical protein